MINNKIYNEAYVWIWLPNEVKPVVAGKLMAKNNVIEFTYGRSYLQRSNAISIYDVELPLQPGILPLLNGLSMPNCIRDAAPDAWGRRVILNKKFGLKGKNVDNSKINELTYLLESGSDRIGALDFQLSPTEFEPREYINVSMSELLESAERVEKGLPLTPELDKALFHGSSIGGARPKALIEHDHNKYIAKFSSSSDLYSVVKAEFIAMHLAKLAGIDLASVSLTQSSHKDVLLVERFDRLETDNGWERKSIISALTLLGLNEMMARYASYESLAEIIRHKFNNASSMLQELFKRLVFNILVGNTDDHARNHATFWDGKHLSLTPAYDICPQSRAGNEASQAMLISGSNRMSKIKSCIDAAHIFLLTKNEAVSIIEKKIRIIINEWDNVCELAKLSEVDKNYFWRRQFLNPYIFEDLGNSHEIRRLAELI